LLDLLADARRARQRGRDSWLDWVWIKQRLQMFVGWFCDRDALASSAAYELAYRRVYAAWIGREEAEPDAGVVAPLPAVPITQAVMFDVSQVYE